MKWYKKKAFIIPMIILAVAVLTTAVVFISYYSTTMSPEQCRNYCSQNSKKLCSEFAVSEDNRYNKSYTYWIAAAGDNTRSQEIFVFRKKPLGLLDLGRYQFFTSSVMAKSYEKYSEVGSLLFNPKKDNGGTEYKQTLIFYGANSDGIDSDTDRKIEYCVYTQEDQNGESEKKLEVTQCKNYIAIPDDEKKPGAWIVKFDDIGYGNEDRKIKNIKFYNKSGELIQEYEN